MIVTVSEFGCNAEKYVQNGLSEDIFITSNGRLVALLTNPVQNKLALIDGLSGILCEETCPFDAFRNERLSML